MDYIEIPLGGRNGAGYFAKVSPEDYPTIAKHSWYYRNGYALTEIKKKEVRMHRFILEVVDPEVIVDHKNRNRLDNRRSNLRCFTPSQNSRNRETNRLITAFGETKCIADWADDPRCGVSYNILAGRLKKGIDPDIAILAHKLQ